jgi:23S rRNA C2498 (ribose-2'-O)-methylase RlmM
MARKYSRKLKVAVAATLIALAGAAVGGWSYQSRNETMRAELLDDALRSTIAFDTAELSWLRATRDDVGTSAYVAAK